MAIREIDPAALRGREPYRLLTSLVVPRPIAWVSTLAQDGTRNLAPHSYFNAISSAPPVVHFTSTGEKDTLRNVRASGEFVVNIVTRDVVEAMNLTAADFPPGEDEFAWAGLDAAPSIVVKPPRVAQARASLECRAHSEVTIGNGTMVFGEVVHVAVDEDVLVDGVADPVRLGAVARLGGSGYVVADRPFHLERPTWERVRRTTGGNG
jgi:flavin reductase (DIM6/NTAB) family NADH-FMN oxidoreductase RutF